MASNIKIVGTIVNTTTVSRYKIEDTNLISSQNLQENFGGKNDYIEFYIYDTGNNLLSIDYSYLEYKLPSSTGLTPATITQPNTVGSIPTNDIGITSTLSSQTGSLYPIIEIDPVKDLQNNGYSSGEFSLRYNIFTNILSNSNNSALFIKEISPDRTEIRLASTTLSDSEIEETVLSLIDKINNSLYYVDYLLNFGNNEQYIAVNVALNKATTGYEVLFKLYEPLPVNIQEKQTLWVVEEKVSPYIFDINLDKLITPPPPPTLRGPNFDIPINEQSQGTVSSPYTNYSTLVSNLQSLQNSSYQKILNLLTSQSIDINIDYSNFDNFVFFGSAYQRLSNFYDKVSEIETYTNFINTKSPLTSSTPNLIPEINKYSSSINDVISQFDGYETYLYFESNSYAWPKANPNKPYQLLSAGSVTVTNWYNALTSSAKEYDIDNYNNLIYAIPPFINENVTNQPFITFLNMVGHYFDNIWIYLKSITDINVTNNNLEAGISKDLVYERLKSLGLKLYNSQAGESVDQFLIGANTGSSIFNNDFSITGSYLNNIPRKDLVAELYKRIYHNLPLLLKTKGTVAGLEHLITTFGLTGSILNVKEFGGGNKTELIKGYNNDKVRIVSNPIAGNVLSPLLSLQTYTTASADFRDSDLHYIDISFSPQTQIDTHISKSIALTNPTWSLDDYIGDPRDQYSTTYPSLDTQRKLYFETGVPGGLAPFTGSALEYSGFVRLIEYFDNSLFKMLNDFVPERASLSTGITINSPVLERNKAVYANPTPSITQSVQEANYDIANITPQYGQLFNSLGGDKKAFYDGNITGSIVDVGQYFEDNYNLYTGDWNVFNLQNPPSKSINLNSFLHSDWNVLLNNVSQSVTSSLRKKIEYIWGTTGSITSSVELQDSYLSLRSYNTSRYEGSKVTSLLYNTYTSTSSTYVGDNSYGKTAAIDKNVRRIGLFTQIASSSLLPKRNNVSLKYLVDEFGGLTDLNQLNDNWMDVQRTFLMADSGSVALFDNKKYSNQKSTDGIKLIFDSGYSYTPIFYVSKSDARSYFDFTGEFQYYFGRSTNFNTSSYFIIGSSSLGYPITTVGGTKVIQNLFNFVKEGPEYMFTGSLGTNYPYFEVPVGGDYIVSASLFINTKYANNTTSTHIFTYTLRIFSGSTEISTVKAYPYSAGITNFIFSPPTQYNRVGTLFSLQQYSTLPRTQITSKRNINLNGTIVQAGTTFYKYNNLVTVQGCNPSTPTSYYTTNPTPLKADKPLVGCSGIYYVNDASLNSIDFYNIFPAPDVDSTSNQTQEVKINYVGPFNAGNKIKLQLSITTPSGVSNPNYTASIASSSLLPLDYRYGSFYVQSVASEAAGTYPFHNNNSDDLFQFAPGDTGTGSLDTILFNKSLDAFYSSNYQFLPYFISGSNTVSSSLYSQYGDVDYPFQLQPFDIFAAYDSSGKYFESRILDVSTHPTTSTTWIKLANPLPAAFKSDIVDWGNGVTPPDLRKVLFIKRVEDETNALLTFQKRSGLTSYGFLIPSNLAPDVLANIDTITSQVKQKLLADQQGLTQ